jgi:hypothetical protein
MSKPNRNRKANETLCVSLINELMEQYKTKNKIASTSVESKTKIRELAELQSLLKAYIH